MKRLIQESKDHLNETGMSYWQHFGHVLFMMSKCIKALWYSPLHAIIPAVHAGKARDAIFKEALDHQLTTRPELLTKGK